MIDPKYTKYADDVLSGKQVACLYIKQACQRYLDWFKRTDIEFRAEKADRVIKFISLLKHFKGSAANKPFILEEWQKFIVYNTFGWYWKGTNKRVIRNVYITMSRKQGKTALAAALSLYLMLADNESAAEIYCCANSSAQASIAFELCKGFSESIDKGPKKYFKRYRESLKFDANKSVLKVVSADADKLDGLNVSAFILDEFGAAKNTALLDVMRSAQGNRENPLGIIISTSGFNLGGPMHTMEQVNKEILSGIVEDDTTFIAIYTLDENDDWTDEKNWLKSCPNLDVTCEREYLKQQVNQARNNPSLEVGVKTKNFNMWVSSSEVWIPDYKVMECMRHISIEEMKTDYAYCGIDLASVRDLTCVTFMTYKADEDKYYFTTKIYLPYDTVTEGITENSYQYQQWVEQGYITLTEGNVTDYNVILNDILEFNREIPLYKIGYDPFNSSQFCIDAVTAGLPMIPFSQTLGSFNRPVKEFERLIYSGKIVIDANPVVRWCFTNASLKFDNMENARPIKTTKSQKIDAVISMLEAMGMKLRDEGVDISITS